MALYFDPSRISCPSRKEEEMLSYVASEMGDAEKACDALLATIRLMSMRAAPEGKIQ